MAGLRFGIEQNRTHYRLQIAFEVGLLVELAEPSEDEPPPQATKTSVMPSKTSACPCRQQNNGFMLKSYGYTSHAGFYHYWKILAVIAGGEVPSDSANYEPNYGAPH